MLIDVEAYMNIQHFVVQCSLGASFTPVTSLSTRPEVAPARTNHNSRVENHTCMERERHMSLS